MIDTVDVVIVGQGLAGITLGWQLIRRGSSIAVIDTPIPQCASRIAAGLLTPITGTRLAATPDYLERRREAVDHYSDVQTRTDAIFFYDRPSVRLFASVSDRERVIRKPVLSCLIRPPEPSLNYEDFAQPFGGFEMPDAGRLDVPAYLSVSRDYFRSVGPYHETELIVPDDIHLEGDTVRLPRLTLRCRIVAFCQGYTDRPNPWFADVPFNATKGEILTVRVPGLHETRVIHGSVWLAPLGGQLFRVGATYDRTRLDHEPTPAGRDELTTKLRHLLKRPFEVVDHRAAVRPIISVRRPVLGTHPAHRRLAFFNGLGSKGTLVAPHYAAMLADHMVFGTPVHPDSDVAGWLRR